MNESINDTEFFHCCDYCGKKSYTNILNDNTAELLKMTQDVDLWICEECLHIEENATV